MAPIKRIHTRPNDQLLLRQLHRHCIPKMNDIWYKIHEENKTIFKYNTELNIITLTQVIITYSSLGNMSYHGH